MRCARRGGGEGHEQTAERARLVRAERFDEEGIGAAAYAELHQLYLRVQRRHQDRNALPNQRPYLREQVVAYSQRAQLKVQLRTQFTRSRESCSR